MEEKKKLKQNIRKLYVIKFFSVFLFLVPVMVLFWQENGLSLTEIMVLQSLYAISIVLLEVPSGYLADRVERKQILVAATISYFLGHLILAFGVWFRWFLLAEILFAFAISFTSWADSAFLYDTLKELWREKEYKKIRGNLKFIFLWMASISAVIGGMLAKYGIWSHDDIFRQVAMLGPLFIFFAIPISVTLYEPTRMRLVIEKKYWLHLKETLAKELRTQKSLWWVMLLFAFLWASTQFALRFYQPYFVHIGVDILYFWFIFGGFQLFTAVFVFSSSLWDEYMGSLFLIISIREFHRPIERLSNPFKIYEKA